MWRPHRSSVGSNLALPLMPSCAGLLLNITGPKPEISFPRLLRCYPAPVCRPGSMSVRLAIVLITAAHVVEIWCLFLTRIYLLWRA